MNQEALKIILAVAAMSVGAVLVLLAGTFTTKKYLGVSRTNAALVFLLSILVGLGVFIYVGRGLRYDSSETKNNMLISAGVLVLFAVPFLVNLYLKWIAGHLTEAEKASGMEGVRAWLRGGNLVCALVISLCAWLGFGYSFWGMLALTLMALLAYPLLNMASDSFKPVEPKTDNLSPERERVLKMLDDGKITASESAELLNALSHTVQPARPQASASSPQRKMILTGLVLLLIGFFLPWFSYNPDDEMARLLGGMQEKMNQISQTPKLQLNLPDMGSVHLSGGDIRYGLGWVVLLLGIAAAAVPYVANHLDNETQQKAKLIGLSAGAIILIYLLTQNMRYVSVGIILGLAGYALQLVGTLKERQSLAR
jgi:hypothetical protein